MRNPYLIAYNNKKGNATRDGHLWAVTMEYWVKWCDASGYLALKGRKKGNAHCDRIINELGYIDGNLQLLTSSDNSSKGSKHVSWNYITREWEIIEQNPVIINDDEQPF